MSNIQELIDTVQADSLQTQQYLQAEQTWQEFMFDMLVEVRDSIMLVQEGLSQYFADERDRFLQEQQALEAARRAEIERLREARGGGFAPVPSSSDGQPAPAATQDDGGGLISGLGIAGLLTGIAAALSGYAVGLVNNLIKIITLGKFDPKLAENLTKAIKGIPNAIRGFALGAIMQIQLLFEKLPKPSMPQPLLKAAESISSFFKDNKIGKFLTRIGNVIKTISTSLVSVFNPKPILDAFKALTGGGQGGGILSKIGTFLKALGANFGRIFTLASKIAVPITAIIAAVKGVFSSFKEFDDDMGFFEKLMITIKNLFKEIVSGFVTTPLELIKDGISAIAGWLGFDGVKEFLDSFDIDQMFRDSVDFIFNSIKDAINLVNDIVYQGLRKLGLADVDPEAEARMLAQEEEQAQQEVEEARQQLAQARQSGSQRDIRNAERDLNNAQSGLAEVTEKRADIISEAKEQLEEANKNVEARQNDYDMAVSAAGGDLQRPEVLIAQENLNKAVANQQAQTSIVSNLNSAFSTQGDTNQTSTVASQTATGDQISTVANQTYTGMQAAKRAAEEQGLEAYRIEPVTEDDGFGEQVETGEYKVIPRQAEATSNQTATGDQISTAGDQISTVANQTATGDQISTVANQTATGDQISTVANQTATGDQISTVANQTATGDQISNVNVQPAVVRAPTVEPITSVDNMTSTAAAERVLSSIRPILDFGSTNNTFDSSVTATAGPTLLSTDARTFASQEEAIKAAESEGMTSYTLEPVTQVNERGEQVDTGEVRLVPPSPTDVMTSVLSNVLGGDTSTVEGSNTNVIQRILGDTGAMAQTSAMTSVLSNVLGGDTSTVEGDSIRQGDISSDLQNISNTLSGDAITNTITATPGLTSLPVAAASTQLDAIKSEPKVSIVNAGSTGGPQQVNNNFNTSNVTNFGSHTARSVDIANRDQQNRMSG